jgi:hypothetical protein
MNAVGFKSSGDSACFGHKNSRLWRKTWRSNITATAHSVSYLEKAYYWYEYLDLRKTEPNSEVKLLLVLLICTPKLEADNPVGVLFFPVPPDTYVNVQNTRKGQGHCFHIFLISYLSHPYVGRVASAPALYEYSESSAFYFLLLRLRMFAIFESYI